MTLTIDQIRAELEVFIEIELSKQEKTIFSIGGRGHYENPISDVLAFYLDPGEDHGLGDLVLRALLVSAAIEQTPNLSEDVHREFATDQGNRLDLVLVGDNWVIAIENKIFHEANNPFEDYKSYLSKTYPNKTPYYLLLSPKGDNADGWKSLDYGLFIATIKSHLGEVLINSPFSKWIVFLRDFLINLSNYVKDASMDDERFEFLHENVFRIYELEKIRKEFLKSIESKIDMSLKQELPGHDITSKIETWPSGPAFRFYSSKWHGKSNVTLYTGLKSNEDSDIRVYIEDANNSEIENYKTLFSKEATPMKNWQEANNTWACFSSIQSYGDFKSAIDDLIKLARLVKATPIQTKDTQ